MFKIILPKLNLNIERWKWNKEYRVYVSTLGNFKDEYKRNLPVKIDKSGYCQIKTACGYKKAHRLVMLTWKPIPNAESYTVDHLNHNKRLNALSNLEWVTKEENHKRAINDLLSNNINNMLLKQSKVIMIKNNNEKKEFKNLDAAVNYLITQSCNVNAKRENVIKNLKKSILNNKKYCDCEWIIL